MKFIIGNVVLEVGEVVVWGGEWFVLWFKQVGDFANLVVDVHGVLHFWFRAFDGVEYFAAAFAVQSVDRGGGVGFVVGAESGAHWRDSAATPQALQFCLHLAVGEDPHGAAAVDDFVCGATGECGMRQ